VNRLSEIFSVFLRLGFLGFGGPVAVIAMIEEEVVRKRAWISESLFSEHYAICKLLPGPVSTQMAITMGRHRGGIWAGVIAGLCFILPSFFMILGLSVAYLKTGMTSQSTVFLKGLQCAALATILLSAWSLSRGFRKQTLGLSIAFVSAAWVALAPSWEPWVILFFGLMGAYRAKRRHFSPLSISVFSFFDAGFLVGLAESRLFDLFWVCFKAAAFVFGTGLAVLPVLEAEAVGHFHWLTHSQFMDGLALGQVTPGPLVITSTFIGFVAAGYSGALVATLGMFLPSFFNVLILVPRIWKKFSGTAEAQAFSQWAIPAVVGGVFATTVQLGRMTLDHPVSWILFLISGWVSVWKSPPAWLLIPMMGVLSLILSSLK
jgi:chromate transporter